MKNSLRNISMLICLSLFTLVASASQKGRGKVDSLSCLKIEGKISNADEAETACTIELIGLNDQIDTVYLKEGKTKFKFTLNKDSYYAIRISKPGYLSKLICVNTEILTEVNGVYKFEFETSLLKEVVVKNLNTDVLDFPVAIVYFDYEKECFSYNKEYSAFIKKELHTKKQSAPKHPKKEKLTELSSLTFASVSK